MAGRAKELWSQAAATTFDTHKLSPAEIPETAADNILIAWPPILCFIKEHLSSNSNDTLRALDYGCGTGGFALELHNKLSARVTGVDYSQGMIDIARKHSNSYVTFETGDHTIIDKSIRFNLITSIMALQFVPDSDIEQLLHTFSQSIGKNGLLVFAVFNPEWVKKCLKENVMFEQFDSRETPKAGKMQLVEDKIPVFIRNSLEYEKLATTNGFIKIMEEYPNFTEAFLTLYPSTDIPTDIPEFLVMGFKKY